MLAILSLVWGVVSKAFGVIFDFCSKPPGIYIAAAAAIALAIWWSGQRGYDRGVADTRAVQQIAETKGKAANKIFLSNIFAVNADVKAKLADDYRHIDITYAAIEQEVPRHVTPDIDHRYPLPCGLVRMHDAAFLGVDASRIAAAGCERDDAAAPATASAFSRNEVEWGKYTNQLEAQNRALRDYITQFRARYEAWRAQLAAIKGG